MFNASNQLLEALKKVQANNDIFRPLVLIQDVSTRFWSTHMAIDRYFVLAPFIELLVQNGTLLRSEMISDRHITELKVLEPVLQPFMTAQKAFEGQLYVTNSLVVYVVAEIRHGLEELKDSSEDPAVVEMIESFLNHEVNGLNTYFGSGEEGTIFTENDTLGYMQRQKGIPKSSLIAYALDPRTKVI